MARYDRIARIEPPDRDDAFSGWLTLRDLDGREREPELGRRARLRYLSLRPVHRLLMKGPDDLDGDSFRRQLDSTRLELERLPSEDPERERLERYLQDMGDLSPATLAAGTLHVGRAMEAAGQLFAAEEFYATALDLSRTHAAPETAVVALRLLGRTHGRQAEWDRAEARLRESATLAADHGLPLERARATAELAEVQLLRGDAAAALRTLAEVAAGSSGPGQSRIQAIAAAGRCAVHLSQGDAEAAIEAGWSAIQGLEPDDGTRRRVLLVLGAAFRRLGLFDSATSCYRIVRLRAPWPEQRIEAQLELTVMAAETGDVGTFTRRRAKLLSLLDPADRPVKARVWLDLSHAASLLGERVTARDHLREAADTARDLHDDPLLRRAERLLDELARSTGRAPVCVAEPTPAARQIAARVLALEAGGV